MFPAAEDQRKRLAYEESVRALTLQSSVLDDLRSRTGILLTAISLTATFVGSRALDDGFTTWTEIAFVLFLLSAGFCLGVLWPAGNWGFTLNASAVLGKYVHGSDPKGLDQMLEEIAVLNQENWEENAERLRWLFWCFRLAVLALALQVPCWLMAIGHANG
jgi:hypothetical protein